MRSAKAHVAAVARDDERRVALLVVGHAENRAVRAQHVVYRVVVPCAVAEIECNAALARQQRQKIAKPREIFFEEVRQLKQQYAELVSEGTCTLYERTDRRFCFAQSHIVRDS